jgi:predicted nucleic acid-binding protein
MSYVYDTSFVGALIIPDEKNQKAEEIHYAIDEKERIYSPQLICYEMANVFNNLLRRRRYINEDIEKFFLSLTAFRISNDNEAGISYSQKLLKVSNNYNLSSYDSAYLELAERKKAVLCTLDEKLKIAAKKHGINVINV